MKKRIFALLAILTMLLVGCGNDYTTVFDEVNTIDGVTLTLKEDTLKSSKATFVLKNDSDKDVEFDPSEYHLETKKNGVWEENIGTRVSEWKRDETETLPAGEALIQQWNGKGFAARLARASTASF